MDYQYITSKALLIESSLKYSELDYHAIGFAISEAYKEKYGKEPLQVLTVNSRKERIKPCSLYPVEFLGTMQEIILNYFTKNPAKK